MTSDDDGREYVVWLDDQGHDCLQLAPLTDDDGQPTEHRGWARYFSGTAPTRDHVFLRIGPTSMTAPEYDPLVVSELHVSAGARVDAQLLRSLPLGRIEAAINRPNHHAALSPRLHGMGHTAPLPKLGKWSALKPEIGTPPELELKLTIPTGRQRRPDSFYRQVAIIYSQLAGQDPQPAPRMAELNGVPVTTVHGWVKEARARGLLAPTRRGTSS